MFYAGLNLHLGEVYKCDIKPHKSWVIFTANYTFLFPSKNGTKDLKMERAYRNVECIKNGRYFFSISFFLQKSI